MPEDTTTQVPDTGAQTQEQPETDGAQSTFDNGAQPKPELARTQEQVKPATEPPKQEAWNWKQFVSQDLAKSPTMQKYANTVDGLNDALKAHLELQKMMGHDKVPVPKGPDDLAAMAQFKKAFNIPQDPEGYNLKDPEYPESMKGVTVDKKGFSSIVHRYNLTPEQAKGIWSEYTSMIQGLYTKHQQDFDSKMTDVRNQLRMKWGDAYDTKVELGQMVVNKFTEDQGENEEITALLAQSPVGIKFLARIGDQFRENKIGDFKYQTNSVTPEEAQKEIDDIRNNPMHPYNNDKATEPERRRAIDYVNSLYAVINKSGDKNFR